MIRKLKNIRNKRYFKIAIIMVAIAIILFVISIVVLRYHVEGETNMPFSLSKISVISSSEGLDKEMADTKWAFDVYQSNDIFLYIEKNNSYGKTEVIKNVTISNMQIESNKKDNIKIYRPDEYEEKKIFINKEENRVQSIEYTGAIESNLKQLKISNQGGIVAFRCSIDNLAEYKSNEEEEINHYELLKKTGVTQEDLKIKLIFDLKIQLEGGTEYKSTVTLDFPVENVIEEGTTSKEITEVKDFIFKRM